ncbi:hypothetical protein HHJ78_00360 [Mobiluncus mulieris]|uniref:Uncharacterized protein n=1 Tax=Mobiluncus mulieris TaxID=2052 RepID=A0A7Y0TZ96_9ACTO|nr:hypothetical protein [Mobiluncus mulieris]NMW64029.1 hypothetical protein [Mobiluncus mulieris]
MENLNLSMEGMRQAINDSQTIIASAVEQRIETEMNVLRLHASLVT